MHAPDPRSAGGAAGWRIGVEHPATLSRQDAVALLFILPAGIGLRRVLVHGSVSRFPSGSSTASSCLFSSAFLISLSLHLFRRLLLSDHVNAGRRATANSSMTGGTSRERAPRPWARTVRATSRWARSSGTETPGWPPPPGPQPGDAGHRECAGQMEAADSSFCLTPAPKGAAQLLFERTIERDHAQPSLLEAAVAPERAPGSGVPPPPAAPGSSHSCRGARSNSISRMVDRSRTSTPARASCCNSSTSPQTRTFGTSSSTSLDCFRPAGRAAVWFPGGSTAREHAASPLRRGGSEQKSGPQPRSRRPAPRFCSAAGIHTATAPRRPSLTSSRERRGVPSELIASRRS